MGGGASNTSAPISHDIEKLKQNKVVENIMIAHEQEERKKIKLLLLGSGESGKR